jgi:hypothetical protein
VEFRGRVASTAYPDGHLVVDQLGTSNLAPLIVLDGSDQRQINPVLVTNHIQVIKDTHARRRSSRRPVSTP